jgi:hypothetical protein
MFSATLRRSRPGLLTSAGGDLFFASIGHLTRG